jgi:hypothetical protein
LGDTYNFFSFGTRLSTSQRFVHNLCRSVVDWNWSERVTPLLREPNLFGRDVSEQRKGTITKVFSTGLVQRRWCTLAALSQIRHGKFRGAIKRERHWSVWNNKTSDRRRRRAEPCATLDAIKFLINRWSSEAAQEMTF